jgi:Leucine-rich repeat (LRR) protein
MHKKTLLITIISTSLLFSQGPGSDSSSTASVDETGIVKEILDQCGMKDASVQKVAVIEQGKVVSLDLTNKEITSDGIKDLPIDIGKLTGLRTFICKNNSLSALPAQISSLSSLVKLDLRNNKFTIFPSEIVKLASLEDLDLRNNEIYYLPDEISDLKNLKILRLWSNKLISLTPAIAQMSSLKELYLKDNRLETLPDGITTMKTLTYIDIIGNKICSPGETVDAWLKSKDKLYHQTQKCW